MKIFKLLLPLFITAVFVIPANAQTIQKKVLTLAIAKKIVAAVEDSAKKYNAGGAIAVVDDGGNLIYFVRIDNTFFAGADVSIGKAWTAAAFKKPTRAFEDAINNGRPALIGVEQMTPLIGGIPIIVDERVIGAIGVSGANTQFQDEDFAKIGANLAVKLLSNPQENQHTFYFEKNSVNKSFDKGSVLYSNDNYSINTSRRDSPGKVEIHRLDTDLFYVLDGNATFITGGEVEGGKETEPNEIRGESIKGGESRRISKGDVFIIPKGTPHWFKDVKSPILYYTVKVR